MVGRPRGIFVSNIIFSLHHIRVDFCQGFSKTDIQLLKSGVSSPLGLAYLEIIVATHEIYSSDMFTGTTSGSSVYYQKEV